MIRLRPYAPGIGIFLGLWALLFVGGRTDFFRDPGTFWHVAVGEKIITDGFFNTDPYTFTFHGKPWIPHQWFGEVVMAGVHRISGFDGLLAVATGLMAATFAGLGARLLRTGLHPVAVIAVVLLALAAGASHFHVRPHLLTIVGLAVTACAVTDVEAGRRSLWSLGWLVPLYLVWSNTHGGAMGGFASLGLVGFGWLGLRAMGRPTPIQSWRNVLLLAMLGLACGMTAVVTPYGTDIARTWLDIMNAPQLPNIIQEHRRTDLTMPSAWPLLALAAVYLFVLGGTKPRDWRVSWFLPLFWLFQAYGRVRHAPLFAVVALVAIADIWPSTRWAAWLRAKRPDFYTASGRIVQWGQVGPIVVGAGIAIALLFQSAGLTGWAKLDPNYWPVELIDTLRSNQPAKGQGNKLFNEYIYGGFAIYYAPAYQVFVDDRCELFGDEWLLQFVQSEYQDTAAVIAVWELDYGRFDFALTRTDSGFDKYFRGRSDWQLVRETETGSFYRRR